MGREPAITYTCDACHRVVTLHCETPPDGWCLHEHLWLCQTCVRNIILNNPAVARATIDEADHASLPKQAVRSEEKETLTGLFRDRPDTPEGKYLIKRRDGSVVEWPSFVLGGRDPHAEAALRAYADSVWNAGGDPGWVAALRRWACTFRAYREHYGNGDPGKGPHRPDDPATVAEMKKGMSA